MAMRRPRRFSISFAQRTLRIWWPCPPQAPGGLGQSPAHLGRTGFRDSDPAFAHGAGVLAGRQPQVGLDLVGAFESVDAIQRRDKADRRSQGPRRGSWPSAAGRWDPLRRSAPAPWSAKAICTLSVSRLTRVARPSRDSPRGASPASVEFGEEKVSVSSSGDPDQLGAQITAHAVDQLGPRADQRFPQGAEGAPLPRHLGGDVDRREDRSGRRPRSGSGHPWHRSWFLREPTPRTHQGSPATTRTSWPAASAASATLNASAEVSTITLTLLAAVQKTDRDPLVLRLPSEAVAIFVRISNANLRFHPTQIDGNVFHGWFSPLRLERVV